MDVKIGHCTTSIAIYPKLDGAFAFFVGFAYQAGKTNTQHNGIYFNRLQ